MYVTKLFTYIMWKYASLKPTTPCTEHPQLLVIQSYEDAYHIQTIELNRQKNKQTSTMNIEVLHIVVFFNIQSCGQRSSSIHPMMFVRSVQLIYDLNSASPFIFFKKESIFMGKLSTLLMDVLVRIKYLQHSLELQVEFSYNLKPDIFYSTS